MKALFAHSEPTCNSFVRHKRILGVSHVRYKSNMSNNIKKIRKSKGMTQQQVYEKAGIAKSYFSELESGKKQLNERTMKSIAGAMGVEPYMLLADSDDALAATLFEDFSVIDPAQRKIVADLAREFASSVKQHS